MGKWPSIPFLHRGFDVSRSMLGRLQTHMVVAMVLCMFGGRWLVATSHTVIYIVDIFYECVFPAAGSHEDPHMQPLEWSTYQSRLNWPGGQGRVQKGSAWPRRWWCDLVRRPQIEKCNKFTGSGVHIHFYIIDQAVIQVERSGPLPVEQYIYIYIIIYICRQPMSIQSSSNGTCCRWIGRCARASPTFVQWTSAWATAWWQQPVGNFYLLVI